MDLIIIVTDQLVYYFHYNLCYLSFSLFVGPTHPKSTLLDTTNIRQYRYFSIITDQMVYYFHYYLYCFSFSLFVVATRPKSTWLDTANLRQSRNLLIKQLIPQARRSKQFIVQVGPDSAAFRCSSPSHSNGPLSSPRPNPMPCGFDQLSRRHFSSLHLYPFPSFLYLDFFFHCPFVRVNPIKKIKIMTANCE